MVSLSAWNVSRLVMRMPAGGGVPADAALKATATALNRSVLLLLEETVMAGLHNTLIRREVFEKMLASEPKVLLGEFDFFYYPRHIRESEDGAFCKEARRLGFRIGSTTKVKCGHITRVTTGWDSYQDYLKYAGVYDRWQRYFELVEQFGFWFSIVGHVFS